MPFVRTLPWTDRSPTTHHLPRLLLPQDIGEEYNETELGLTESYLDPDRLGVLPFEDFVHWWCE